MLSVYDYIIVGADSAGCVPANRLSADPAGQARLCARLVRGHGLRYLRNCAAR